ncbi:Transmembrane protein 187 [Acropora cervicornis]|uniref:Transmembrane protein 187 n=1 Tax=Acropora cervicornis TaxID=6130 RepID=A0AAD9UZW6_ACRCE|nr:Transmembrane protein 187 [Acropora cervicornis]
MSSLDAPYSIASVASLMSSPAAGAIMWHPRSLSVSLSLKTFTNPSTSALHFFSFTDPRHLGMRVDHVWYTVIINVNRTASNPFHTDDTFRGKENNIPWLNFTGGLPLPSETNWVAKYLAHSGILPGYSGLESLVYNNSPLRIEWNTYFLQEHNQSISMSEYNLLTNSDNSHRLQYALTGSYSTFTFFERANVELGFQHYAEKADPNTFLKMPANANCVNLGYGLVGLYWLWKVNRRKKKLRDKAFFYYVFAWMSMFYGLVQFGRIVTQTRLFAILDQWLTLPFFAWIVCWNEFMYRGYWQTSRYLFTLRVSVLSYFAVLCHDFAFDVLLGLHILAAVVYSIRTQHKPDLGTPGHVHVETFMKCRVKACQGETQAVTKWLTQQLHEETNDHNCGLKCCRKPNKQFTQLMSETSIPKMRMGKGWCISEKKQAHTGLNYQLGLSLELHASSCSRSSVTHTGRLINEAAA